jgi:hypothetical protein
VHRALPSAGSRRTRLLDIAVRHWTGKGVDDFRGDYYGAENVVD